MSSLAARPPLWTHARWTSLTCGAAGVAGDVAFDPVHRHVPLCPFRAITGWDCPFCGSLRAVDRLVHGQVDAALQANAVLVLALPLLAWMWFDSAARRATGQRPRHAPRWAVAAGVLVLAAFTVVRNLPSMSVLRPA